MTRECLTKCVQTRLVRQNAFINSVGIDKTEVVASYRVLWEKMWHDVTGKWEKMSEFAQLNKRLYSATPGMILIFICFLMNSLVSQMRQLNSVNFGGRTTRHKDHFACTYPRRGLFLPVVDSEPFTLIFPWPRLQVISLWVIVDPATPHVAENRLYFTKSYQCF